ncbi:ribbon-helix-helix domain-containing protein [Spirosoma sordidisoli]|uniref:Antitoxin-like ribbon-helix-helix domain-containing protein n=1 Tax=Spirosoma sordidisoli TaxID=2502893 RepID=A0A4Q2UC55_9BACT|nr:ribbon-helix-helix domain-containing protein [Spirosoma sordidisoli]RYC66336.1 hypothetical protein EQG79_30135 [Spirosoma sordidisoli]
MSKKDQTPLDAGKDAFLKKFSEPAKPILTQVVPVEPAKPAKTPLKELDHFNLYTDKTTGKKLRLLKVETGLSVQDLLTEAVTDLLAKYKQG